jgi:hypothetical protein
VLGIIGGACAANRELKEARTMTPRIFIRARSRSGDIRSTWQISGQTPYDAFQLLSTRKEIFASRRRFIK